MTNARNIHVTGKKAQQKVYYHHTMYPGGLKERHFKDLIKRKPEDVRIISLTIVLIVCTVGESITEQSLFPSFTDYP